MTLKAVAGQGWFLLGTHRAYPINHIHFQETIRRLLSHDTGTRALWVAILVLIEERQRTLKVGMDS